MPRCFSSRIIAKFTIKIHACNGIERAKKLDIPNKRSAKRLQSFADLYGVFKKSIF